MIDHEAEYQAMLRESERMIREELPAREAEVRAGAAHRLQRRKNADYIAKREAQRRAKKEDQP